MPRIAPTVVLHSSLHRFPGRFCRLAIQGMKEAGACRLCNTTAWLLRLAARKQTSAAKVTPELTSPPSVPEVPRSGPPAVACAPLRAGAAYCFELWHHTKADMKASVASVLLLATLVASSLAHICILAPDQVRSSPSLLDCGTQEAWSDPHSAEEQMSRAPETPRASSRMVIDEQHPCSAGHG